MRPSLQVQSTKASKKRGDAVPVGVPINNEIKERMRVTLATMLRSDTVHLSTPFISRSMDGRGDLVTQLRGYSFYVKQTNKEDPTRPQKTFLTGKIGGRQDDLSVVAQMGAFWSMVQQREGNSCLKAI